MAFKMDCKNTENITELFNMIRELESQQSEAKATLEEHIKDESQKFSDMIAAIQQNTDSISELTASTKTMVELNRDIKGAVRVGSSVQGFILWTAKLGAGGLAVAYALTEILAHFKDN